MKTHFWSILLCISLSAVTQVAIAQDSAGELTLKGYFFERPDKTILHVEMVGTRMVFKLLDEDHQAIENVFTRGVMSINPRGGFKKRMAIRPTGDGMSLQSVKVIKKPHLLKVWARLYKGEGDETGESFNFFYNQHTVDEVTVMPPKE